MAIKKTFVKIEMVDTIRSIDEKNLVRFQRKGWKLVKEAKATTKSTGKTEDKGEVKKELDV